MYIHAPTPPSQGVRFIADEALEEAVRYYRECRELCVDLLADVEDEGNGRFDQSDEASQTAIDESRSTLLRAEFNLGMALVEQKDHADAVPHLLAVQERFHELSTTSNAEREKTARGTGTEAGGAASDLTGLYASSLVRLAECYTSSSTLPSMPTSSTTPNAHNKDSGRDGRRAATGNAAAITTGGPTPLGAPTAPAPARLNAAVEALEKAAHTFLDIGDPGGALEALERLVRILRLLGHSKGGGERYLSRTEALCNRTSRALPPPPLSATGGRRGEGGGEGDGADGFGEEGNKHESVENDEEDDDTTSTLHRELQQVRDEICNLRERWGGGGGANGATSRNTGRRADKSNDARRSVVHRVAPAEERESSNSTMGRACGNTGASSGSKIVDNPAGTGAGTNHGCQFLGRVGPALSTPGFARRRRARATASLGHRAGGRDNARGRRVASGDGQTSSSDALDEQVTVEVPLVSEVESAGQHLSGRGDVNSGSVGAAGEDGRSFAQLRTALGPTLAAAAAAVKGGASNGSKHEADEGGVFSAYKDTVSSGSCSAVQQSIPVGEMMLRTLLYYPYL